jgi:proline iminopeptidase
LNFIYLIISLFLAQILISGCQKSHHSKPKSPVERAFKEYERPITRENYLNGKKFCASNSDITSKEFGTYVKVALDYKNPRRGFLEIYAWSVRPFNSRLPSMILVDGGPGQNTHGMAPLLNSDWNEIHFDQRGLGCSAPENYDLYKESWLYSTQNTVNDMDEIRQKFGIERWSPFGISYGTVPATIYASQFAGNTKAITLEGVVNAPEQLGSSDWYVEKWNLVLSQLNPDQVRGFSRLLSNERYVGPIIYLMTNMVYSDLGLQSTVNYLGSFIRKNGTIDFATLKVFEAKLVELQDEENSSPSQQSPFAVDQNIFGIIYCRDLGNDLIKTTYDFDFEKNVFYSRMRDSDSTCDDLNVPYEQRHAFRAAMYPVLSPVSYFQGSHDGATLAKGAFKHFYSVPQGQSNFLLNLKGGHNVLSQYLMEKKLNDDSDTRSQDIIDSHRALFMKALEGRTITENDVYSVNELRIDLGKWELYDKMVPESQAKFQQAIAGIKKMKKGSFEMKVK